jgi:hypothetical protein
MGRYQATSTRLMDAIMLRFGPDFIFHVDAIMLRLQTRAIFDVDAIMLRLQTRATS